jgi:hypothetical protein
MFKTTLLQNSKIQYLILILLTLFSLAGYLLLSSTQHGPGFPLDDSWIHQAYARNLAQLGEWAFIPGQPSAGSTSPLWSALLSIGYLLKLAPYTFTFFLGWLVLLGISLLGMSLFNHLLPNHLLWSLTAGLFLALEWHLVWAAASGMETLLFSLLALAVLALLISASSQKIPPPFRGGQGGGILHRQGGAGGDSSNNLPTSLGGGEGGVSFTDKDGPVEASSILDSPPLTKGGLGGDSSNNLPLPLREGKGGVFLTIGLLIALSVWLRPDGLTLLAPALLVAMFIHPNWPSRLRSCLYLFLGFAALFLPYLLFNQAIAGAVWPNTFYAKQAEYAVLRQLPLWQRLLDQALQPLIGAGALLLPGFVCLCLQALKKRSWALITAVLWLLGYLGMYALRLPVTYQHGRYVMPAMPVYFLLGLVGLALLLDLRSANFIHRILSRAWAVSLVLVLLSFWWLGANTYARDVGVIQTEMVAISHWVNANTHPHNLIAAHDIGALGYFAGRPLLDLAGLVSPEVIPFIRDEGALADYLDQQGADYLVTFPGWYPQLTAQAELIYQTDGEISPALGYENMAVYRWPAER